MAASEQLIGALADGHFVSGEAIADRLGITRAAVWKQVRALRRRGIPVDAVRGRGYRIHGGVPLLRRESILDGLHLPVRTRLNPLEVVWEIDSTNARLLAQSGAGPAACIAEYQSAGRGRRGRVWHAPFGAAVCVSVAYPFAQPPAGFGGIGLVAGVAVADALAALGYTRIGLKWPNDLMIGDAKLGGLLVESRSESGGATRAVIGVGVNWRVPTGALDALVEQRWTDLAATPVTLPSRDALVAALLNALIGALDEFAAHGFAPFRARWAAYDALLGRPVAVQLDRQRIEGVADGIDSEGALRVLTDAGPRRFTAGDVSVREAR